MNCGVSGINRSLNACGILACPVCRFTGVYNSFFRHCAPLGAASVELRACWASGRQVRQTLAGPHGLCELNVKASSGHPRLIFSGNYEWTFQLPLVPFDVCVYSHNPVYLKLPSEFKHISKWWKRNDKGFFK